MREIRASDGGLYLPARIPALTGEELNGLLSKGGSEIVAQILNRFFGTKLTDRQIGELLRGDGVPSRHMSHRIVFCELWQRSGESWEEVLANLAELICGEGGVGAGTWLRVAAKVAFLFAAVAQLRQSGAMGHEEKADLFVMSGDLIGLFAGWYAMQMGLPLGNVVCCCNENSAIWDLLNRGQIKLDARRIGTGTPECDYVVPPGLELLIYAALGEGEAARFVEQLGKGGTYFLNAEQQRHLREGLDAFVVSARRLGDVVVNLYKTNGYVLCPYNALIYSGLMNYRSHTRRRCVAMIMSTKSPLTVIDRLAPLLGEEPDALRRKLRGGV